MNLDERPADMGRLWPHMQAHAETWPAGLDGLKERLYGRVMRETDWRRALAALLAPPLADSLMPSPLLNDILLQGMKRMRSLGRSAALDLLAIQDRDPACRNLCEAMLFGKGWQALQVHRIAHAYWHDGFTLLASMLQYRVSLAFGVDIHPAAQFGAGILLDHATGFVAGETAVVEDEVSLLHAVTLGGRGLQRGDRHPKIRRGASIGAGAVLLGAIEVGAGAKVGAGSTVVDPVPAGATVVGNRASSPVRKPP